MTELPDLVLSQEEYEQWERNRDWVYAHEKEALAAWRVTVKAEAEAWRAYQDATMRAANVREYEPHVSLGSGDHA